MRFSILPILLVVLVAQVAWVGDIRSQDRAARLTTIDDFSEHAADDRALSPDEMASTALADRLSRAVLREVLPLALVTPSVKCEHGDDFVDLTKAVYFLPNTSVLPQHKRVLVVKVRDANNAIGRDGNLIQYRLKFPWVSGTGRYSPNLYAGNAYWGRLNEGGWSTFELKEAVNEQGQIENPSGAGERQKNYWQLQVRATGIRRTNASGVAQHVVFDSQILVYDVKE